MNKQQVDSDVKVGFISHLSPSSIKRTKQKQNSKQTKGGKKKQCCKWTGKGKIKKPET